MLLITVGPLVAALKLSTNLQPADLTVGRVVIPTLASSGWQSPAEFRRARAEMFAQGLYPGVDYTIEERDQAYVTLRPIYPLVKRLEREDWPVTVDASLAPRWMDPAAYNILSGVFALGLAASGLLFALFLSLFLTFSYVPSASMQSAIEPRDVLLVETLTPRLRLPLQRGDLVFFEPPEALQAVVAERQAAAAAAAAPPPLSTQDGSVIAASATASGARDPSPQPPSLPPLFAKRQLFVKRVVGLPGDQVTVDRTGTVSVNGHARDRAARLADAADGAAADGDAATRSASQRRRPPLLDGLLPASSELVVPEAAYFVAGDNAEVSIDSRVWGALPSENVVGRPLLRVLPLSRFGKVQ